MIKAVNIIDSPPTEIAYILWQWLQDEPFNVDGALYIKNDEWGYKLAVYWDRTVTRKLYPSPGRQYIEILCRETIVTVMDKNQGLWQYQQHGMGGKEFNIMIQQQFESLLTYLRRHIPGHKWVVPGRKLP